jgi:hypothetical protein
VTNDVDTLLTAPHVEIDDHVALPRQGRGQRPKLTDADLICLAVAQALLGFDSEHRWIRFACGRLGHLFPYLPNQPGYHKGLRAAASRHGRRMSKARLVIIAVVVEGRSQGEVARAYGVSQGWVSRLVARVPGRGRARVRAPLTAAEDLTAGDR